MSINLEDLLTQRGSLKQFCEKHRLDFETINAKVTEVVFQVLQKTLPLTSENLELHNRLLPPIKRK